MKTVLSIAIVLLIAVQSRALAQEEQTEVVTESHQGFIVERDPDVPELPFIDNPDPTLCGIPQSWDGSEVVAVTGTYEDELLQPIVFLYDSHFRRSIVGRVPDGMKVQILLSQENPELNYYFVRSVDLEDVQEGWIPAPFLVLEPEG